MRSHTSSITGRDLWMRCALNVGVQEPIDQSGAQAPVRKGGVKRPRSHFKVNAV